MAIDLSHQNAITKRQHLTRDGVIQIKPVTLKIKVQDAIWLFVLSCHVRQPDPEGVLTSSSCQHVEARSAIKKIVAQTGVKIDIEDDGTVYIASPDSAAATEAKRIIDGIVKEIEVGDVYLGSVVGIKDFGAFINLKPGTDGLLHISRIANKRVEKVEDVLSMGEQVLVRVIDIDPKTGKISLTRKDMLPAELQC